jgi:hypothetical protein
MNWTRSYLTSHWKSRCFTPFPCQILNTCAESERSIANPGSLVVEFKFPHKSRRSVLRILPHQSSHHKFPRNADYPVYFKFWQLRYEVSFSTALVCRCQKLLSCQAGQDWVPQYGKCFWEHACVATTMSRPFFHLFIPSNLSSNIKYFSMYTSYTQVVFLACV